MNTKTQAFLSYLGLLWLVAYFGGKDQRNAFSNYHLKQGLGLNGIGACFNLVLLMMATMLPGITIVLVYLNAVVMIFVVFGVIHVANDVKKPLPIIGKQIERLFPFLNK